jgi:hypothetical protein
MITQLLYGMLLRVFYIEIGSLEDNLQHKTIVNNFNLVLGSAITETQSFFPNQELTLDNCVPLLAAKVKGGGRIDIYFSLLLKWALGQANYLYYNKVYNIVNRVLSAFIYIHE